MISQKFPNRFGSPATKQLKFVLILHNDWFERYNIYKTAFKQLSVETSYNSGHNILEIYCLSVQGWFATSKTGVNIWSNQTLSINYRTTLDLGS